MKEERWIVIPSWDRFQHYGNRSPIWIKNYTRLLSSSEYLSLSVRSRGILHGIWLLYASSWGELGASPAQLGRMLGLSEVRTRDIQRLVDAGFIEVSASKPLAQNRREKNIKGLPVRLPIHGAVDNSKIGNSIGFEIDINNLLKEIPL